MSEQQKKFLGFDKNFDLDIETLTKYGKALIMIASMDDELAPQEKDWLYYNIFNFNIPEEVRKEWDHFDPKDQKIQDFLESVTKGENSELIAKNLLLCAIQMSQADGTYAAKEKMAIKITAEMLKIDSDTVSVLETIAQLETSVARLRKLMFK